MRSILMVLLPLIWAMLISPASAENYQFPSTQSGARQLVIDSTTDIDVIRPIIRAFQSTRPEIGIEYRELSTVALHVETTKACKEERFLSDLVFSSAMDLQIELVNEGCAASLPNRLPAILPDYARWRDELFGLTFEPAVIVYNRKAIRPEEAPADHFDLLDLLRQPDRFSGKVGTYDIELSGLGYLYATLDSQQSSTWGRLIEALGRNHVQLFCCTSEILQRVADGRLTIGYNVLGSYALIEAARNPDLAIVTPSDYSLVLTRAAFVPRTARNARDAEEFLIFTQSVLGRHILGTESMLFSPIDGVDAFAKAAGLTDNARLAMRPVSLTPVLMVGLDRMKRRLFLKQWRESLNILNN